MNLHEFKFELGARVAIVASGEAGVVRARAQFAAGEDAYRLRYRAADGRAVEAWWEESALTEQADSPSTPQRPAAAA